MDIPTLTTFFMWSTIINGSILVIWTLVFGFASDFVFRVQTWLFPMPRETFNVVVYSALGVYRILFIVFNITPLIALHIIG